MIENFPSFFSNDEGIKMVEHVTLEEIRKVFPSSVKDKTPSLDGWTMELFLTFFDLLGNDLLKVVEESKTRGEVCGAFNATFIDLIPKWDKPNSFNDYRPICLCNVIYKIIINISNMIKSLLSKYMSQEQFGFLNNRQSLDSIGVFHERLHGIKVKKIKSLVLNLDLIKAYDRVDWDLLRLTLLQVDISLEATNWLMGCMSSTNYDTLVNEEPS